MLLALEVEPHLAHAKKVEVVDVEGRDDHRGPAQRRDHADQAGAGNAPLGGSDVAHVGNRGEVFAAHVERADYRFFMLVLLPSDLFVGALRPAMGLAA